MIKVPLKLIIRGEHFVLHTKKAISCTLSLFVNYEYHFSNISKINAFGIEQNLDDNENFFAKIIKNFHSEIGLENIINFTISVTKDHKFHEGGLGFSSNFIIGISKCLCELYNIQFEKCDFINLCKNIEKKIHKSSGLDIQTILNLGFNEFSESSMIELKNCIKKVLIFQTKKPKFTTSQVIKSIKIDKNDVKNHTNNFKNLITNFKSNNLENIQRNLTESNLILNKLGIISDKNMQFVEDVYEKFKIVVKISGSGTIGHLDENSGLFFSLFFDESFNKIDEINLSNFCEKLDIKSKFIDILYG